MAVSPLPRNCPTSHVEMAGMKRTLAMVRSPVSASECGHWSRLLSTKWHPGERRGAAQRVDRAYYHAEFEGRTFSVSSPLIVEPTLLTDGRMFCPDCNKQLV